MTRRKETKRVKFDADAMREVMKARGLRNKQIDLLMGHYKQNWLTRRLYFQNMSADEFAKICEILKTDGRGILIYEYVTKPDSLCWECAKATNSGCSWSKEFVHVPGTICWRRKKGVRDERGKWSVEEKITDTVIFCPEYVEG